MPAARIALAGLEPTGNFHILRHTFCSHFAMETSAVFRFDSRTIRATLRAGDLEGKRRGHAIRISRSWV